ncbi:hypothetical protein CVS40_11890 [Lucilia cuprina]|nr:hypothetical protein CVS40_11890 [Lucilia cuprina]
MKCFNGRGQKSFKDYVAVFVCMTTKALEAVSNLTTEAFHAALKGFFAMAQWYEFHRRSSTN